MVYNKNNNIFKYSFYNNIIKQLLKLYYLLGGEGVF